MKVHVDGGRKVRKQESKRIQVRWIEGNMVFFSHFARLKAAEGFCQRLIEKHHVKFAEVVQP
jgi:hypothetical protein